MVRNFLTGGVTLVQPAASFQLHSKQGLESWPFTSQTSALITKLCNWSFSVYVRIVCWLTSFCLVVYGFCLGGGAVKIFKGLSFVLVQNEDKFWKSHHFSKKCNSVSPVSSTSDKSHSFTSTDKDIGRINLLWETSAFAWFQNGFH